MLSYTLFSVGEETFGYETSRISETVKVERIFPVPKAPHYIKGVINLRNRVIPLVDMGRLLWDKPTESDTAIILEIEGSLVGLLVDKVLGITDVEWGDIKTKEDIEIKNLREDLIRGVFERDERVVFILDLSPVIKVERKKKSSKRKKKKREEESPKTKEGEELFGFVVFSLGEEWHAFPVDDVREIINYPSQVSPIPQSPEYVEGVFLLRGEEYVLMSLRNLLGIPSDREEQRVIMLSFGRGSLGVAVDDVKEIRWVPRSSILSLEREGSKGVIVLEGGSRLVYILNAEELFRGDEIEELVDTPEKGEVLEVKEMRNFVRFNVGSIDMAIPIERVKEVIEVEEVTPLPGAPDYVKGMYNLRNSVIAVIDLSKKLGISSEEDSDRVVVLEGMPIGLVVTKLRGIMRVEEENIQPAQDLAGMEENLLEGIIKTEDGGIVFILDIDKVVLEEDLKLIKEEAVKDGGE